MPVVPAFFGSALLPAVAGELLSAPHGEIAEKIHIVTRQTLACRIELLFASVHQLVDLDEAAPQVQAGSVELLGEVKRQQFGIFAATDDMQGLEGPTIFPMAGNFAKQTLAAFGFSHLQR